MNFFKIGMVGWLYTHPEFFLGWFTISVAFDCFNHWYGWLVFDVILFLVTLYLTVEKFNTQQKENINGR